MKKRRIGIYGASCPDGVQLMRVLSIHPLCDLAFVADDDFRGDLVHDRFPGLAMSVRGHFHENLPELIESESADLAFVAGENKALLRLVSDQLPEAAKLIDLTTDRSASDRAFEWGVLDRRLSEIADARRVAMPSPIAVAVLPALAPLAELDLLGGDVEISATLGTSAAGANERESGEQSLTTWLSRGAEPQFSIRTEIHVGDFRSGVIAEASFPISPNLAMGSMDQLYRSWIDACLFTRLLRTRPELHDVLESNRVHIHLQAQGDRMRAVCVADTMGRAGAMGAIEVANVMLGLPQEAGLLFGGRGP